MHVAFLGWDVTEHVHRKYESRTSGTTYTKPSRVSHRVHSLKCPGPPSARLSQTILFGGSRWDLTSKCLMPDCCWRTSYTTSRPSQKIPLFPYYPRLKSLFRSAFKCSSFAINFISHYPNSIHDLCDQCIEAKFVHAPYDSLNSAPWTVVKQKSFFLSWRNQCQAHFSTQRQ